MLRPQDVSSYPEYTAMNNVTPIYCVANKGDCGARIPLYQFDSEEYAGKILITRRQKAAKILANLANF